MPVSFDPLPVPRFDQSLLSYLSQNFARISKSISSLSKKQLLVPMFFDTASGSIAAGAGVVILQNNTNLITAPYPLRMEIEVLGSFGFSAAPSDADFDIVDHAGVSICKPGVQSAYQSTVGARWFGLAIRGHRTYNINDQVGYQLLTACTGGSNFFTRLSTKISFHPLS